MQSSRSYAARFPRPGNLASDRSWMRCTTKAGTDMNTTEQIDGTMAQWMQTKRFTADAKTNAAIRERVEALLESGGYVSTSHFERAYLELLNEDVIQPFRGSIAEQPAAAPLIPPDVIAWIENPRVSSFEQRRRYATDPQFKKYYDLYLNTQLK